VTFGPSFRGFPAMPRVGAGGRIGIREYRMRSPTLHRILTNEQLSPNVFRLVVEAPRIAEIRRPGQFVIVHLGPGSERIPLTIADANPEAGTISLVVQAVGKSTYDLVELQPGQAIGGIAGPLGKPTDLPESGHAVCVGGGVGTAVILPIAQDLHRRGVQVTSIIGGRSREWVILEPDLARCGDVIACTDDGSYGRPGFVTQALEAVLAGGNVDEVFAVGPVPMMRAVVAITRPLGVPTTVSLNPVMVDGTGMCGGCRVTVSGQTRYACVDGPEFDGASVDFDELADRLSTYRSFERTALERREACRVGLRTAAPAGTPEVIGAGSPS
jgi:ferredoxin/flavodoxin---NADP+ reductase